MWRPEGSRDILAVLRAIGVVQVTAKTGEIPALSRNGDAR
jgi:hypothetical protein